MDQSYGISTSFEFQGILENGGGIMSLLVLHANTISIVERLKLAENLLIGSIINYDDASAVEMLRLVKRAFLDLAGNDVARMEEQLAEFHDFLAKLFWEYLEPLENCLLPGNIPKLQALMRTRLLIFGELIQRWELTLIKKNIRAFHRIVAMGWPRLDCGRRSRWMPKKEHDGIREIVRDHVAKLLRDAGNDLASIDAAVRPWLELPDVPDELRNILVVARAKAGGVPMALRDIQNATGANLVATQE